MPPKPESERRRLRRAFAAIVGPDGVLTEPDELLVYESDGLTIFRAIADAVVFPRETAEVAACVRLANAEGLPFVARGAGTGLAGGCLPTEGGVVITLTRMHRILEVDYANQLAVVEPGLVNLHLSQALVPAGFYYAPDPSSQLACTIGGNVANNSGGPHTLKYGVTTNHVLGLEIVLPDGEVVWLGGKVRDPQGYDLVGLFVGSEGTFGIATKVVVRIGKPFYPPKAERITSDAARSATDEIMLHIAELLPPEYQGEYREKVAARALGTAEPARAERA